MLFNSSSYFFELIKQTMIYYKPTFNMLRLMYKWTNDFEKDRQTYENLLLGYKDKLIWIKSEKELNGSM